MVVLWPQTRRELDVPGFLQTQQQIAGGEVPTDGGTSGVTAGPAGPPVAELDMLPPFEPEGVAGRLTLVGDLATVGLAEDLADRLVETTAVVEAHARSCDTTQGPNWAGAELVGI